MFVSKREYKELQERLRSCEESLDATHRQLEIRIAETLPGGRHFNGGMPARTVNPLPHAGYASGTVKELDTRWWLSNKDA